MKFISHRGNLHGANEEVENTPEYIDIAISKGFDVEVDIRYIDKILYLGHDLPEYKISMNWLSNRNSFLWIHCKDYFSLEYFSLNKKDFNYFFHINDSYVLTSKGFIWTYPGEKTGKNSICVMPEKFNKNFERIHEFPTVYGFCSDHIEKIKSIFNTNGYLI